MSTDKTPLYLAVQNKHEHVVKLLLESNADANMRYKQDPEDFTLFAEKTGKDQPCIMKLYWVYF